MTKDFTEKLLAGDEYAGACGVALMELNEAGERLFECACQLAFKGPWREAAERAPAGEVVSVSSERLRATGNKDIVALMDAYAALHAAWQALLRRSDTEGDET